MTSYNSIYTEEINITRNTGITRIQNITCTKKKDNLDIRLHPQSLVLHLDESL